MKPRTTSTLLSAALLIAVFAALQFHSMFADNPNLNPDIKRILAQVKKLNTQGNYLEAYRKSIEVLHTKSENSTTKTDSEILVLLLNQAMDASGRLGNRDKVLDELLTKSIAAHPEDWRLLRQCAMFLSSGIKQGSMVNGAFQRGVWGDANVSSEDRDRVQCLQWLRKATELALQDPEASANERSNQLRAEANQYVQGFSWQLQVLTNLDELPDYEPFEHGRGFRRRPGMWIPQSSDPGYPVDAEGKPVFYKVPDSWQNAVNDGERYRFLMDLAAQTDPSQSPLIQYQLAQRFSEWFGVSTISNSQAWGRMIAATQESDATKFKQSLLNLSTLAENETITRFASGIKRHTLPDEFNYLGILKEVGNSSQNIAGDALILRARLLENRRQLVAAAETWQQLLDRFGQNKVHREMAERHLYQIRSNLGELKFSAPQPAGENAKVTLLFRNATKVDFQAQRILVDKIYEVVTKQQRERAKGKTIKQGDWNWLTQAFGNLLQGQGTIRSEQLSDYLEKEPVAVWSHDLQPAPEHADRLADLSTPLRDAGFYLVEAQFPNGNRTRNIVEITDLIAFTKNKLDEATHMGFVVDAVSGKPIANASIEAFGSRRVSRPANPRPKFEWDIREQKLSTDANGFFELSTVENEEPFQWLLRVNAPDGRKTWLGLHRIFQTKESTRSDYDEQKIFLVSDRPVYRPGQLVHLSAWARRATYSDERSGNQFAGNSYTCTVNDPRGQTIFNQTGHLNEHGAAELTFTLDANATLGAYQVFWRVDGVVVNGHLPLHVEEYKKPEFEVLVHTPEAPVQLGESFNATIEAKYYFGSPVTNAQVQYKVERTIHEGQWFPIRPWDWLYGQGYWWRNSEYSWLPDYHRCIFYWPPWWSSRQDPPEIVAQGTIPIGPDGKVNIPVDTSLAKELHGDKDHRYQITAEVVDSSRRMIVGSGQVIAPRDPFKVYVWMNRGFYETGKEAIVHITARDPLSKKVAGTAKLKVLEVAYQKNGDDPRETQVAEFELKVSADQEHVQQSLQFPKEGQYRIAVDFTDDRKRTASGTVTTTVRGPNFQDGKPFRFPDLEVIAEKEHYAPGETVLININTNNEGATLMIFDRPNHGAYRKPSVVTIADGKSIVQSLPIKDADQPNIFVEVVTVHKAQLHRKLVQIPVPPTKRIAELKLAPSKETYTPQQDGSVQIKVTDTNGRPVKGQVLITAYDKALEYISGGSNIPSVRDFFWGWKRHHYPHENSTLNMVLPFPNRDDKSLSPIGIFGQHLDVSIDTTTADAVTGGAREMRRSLSFSAPNDGALMDSIAAPAPVPAASPAPTSKLEKEKAVSSKASDKEAAEAVPMLRQDFADLLFWKASVTTNEQGIATVPFKTTDDLTTWKIRAWTLGPNNEVGEADVEIITRKNLLVRLQAPRFFVEKDEVVISGIVQNDLKEAQDVRAVLNLDGDTLAPIESVSLEQRSRIEPGKEHRFDWRIKVQKEGEAKVRIEALAAIESDAVEKTFPALVHGMERQDAWSLSIRPDQTDGKFTIHIPEKRRPSQTRLEIRYSPSLAAAMVDALPFLISYPHGCTEQTLNRFVPTVVTQKVLNDLGLDLKTIKEKRANLNAQEIGEPTLRAAQWQRWKDQAPVFDKDELNKMVRVGIDRLQSMQSSDGAWGWWPGATSGSPHLTAQVVEGLLHAKSSGADVPAHLIEQGSDWLINYESEQLKRLRTDQKDRNYKAHPDHTDALVHSVLVSVGKGDEDMLKRLYDSRLHLSKAMQARLGLIFHFKNDNERRDMIIRNLEQFQKDDETNQTAWLDFGNQHSWWYWYDDEIETLSAYLQLRVLRDPKDPVAPALVKYLLNNRKNGTYWRSTRDTAAALLALAAYMKASHETDMDLLVEIWIDGKKVKEAPVTKDNLFTYDHSLVLSGKELTSGDHHIEIKRKGNGALYANAYLTCFTLEDHLRAAGLEVQVQRKLYRLIPEETKDVVAGSRGQALQQKGQRYRREPIADDAEVTSGDLIEVELLVDSKNDYEYLMLEDFKPAGCEAVELQSGYLWASRLHPYREFRDQKVTHYLERLPRGSHSLKYQLRAEIPGRFSALPSVISGMYAPELKGNAEEIRVKVVDTNH